MPFLLFNHITPGLILSGQGDPKGMPLYFTTNGPFSLRSVLWLFKYTFVRASKTIWKCNYHVFHLHKYIRDGFIYVLRYIICILGFLPLEFSLFQQTFLGQRRLCSIFSHCPSKGTWRECAYPQEHLSSRPWVMTHCCLQEGFPSRVAGVETCGQLCKNLSEMWWALIIRLHMLEKNAFRRLSHLQLAQPSFCMFPLT